jgi:hypothetical protein
MGLIFILMFTVLPIVVLVGWGWFFFVGQHQLPLDKK